MNVRAATPEELAWVEDCTGCVLTRHARGVLAEDSRGIRGMVAFDGWTLNACQAHMAVDSPIVWRHLLGPALEYPFQQAGKGIILATIVASNAKSVAMVQHLGFRLVHQVQDGWRPGEALNLYELRREDCAQLQRKAA